MIKCLLTMNNIMMEAQDKQKQSLLEDRTESQKKYNQFKLTSLQQLIDKVGGEGKYQLKIWLIFNLIWFLSSLVLVGQGFFFDDQYSCFDDKKEKQCQTYVCKLPPEQRASAIKQHANSIVFAFKSQYLICEYDYLKPLLTSFLYIGSFVGFFVIPFIADNWGRKIAIRISWGSFIIADSINIVGLGQLLAGFGLNPAITLCYSFLNQQVLREKRQRYGVVLQLSLAFGQCIIAFLFIPKDSWRKILWCLVAASIVTLILINYVEESPKYLAGKSKEQTFRVLNNIAKKNGHQPLPEDDIQKIEIISDKQSSASILDLFRYKSLRWITLCAGFVFLGTQIMYYSTLLNLDNIGFSKIINQQIIGLSEAVGYIVIQFIISKMYRRKNTILATAITSILCFVLALFTIIENDKNLHVMEILQTIGLIFNRFVLCGFWALFFVYVAQLYPTKVRSMGYGWSSAMGTIGSSLAPHLIYLSQKININSWIPPGIFGLIGFGCAFCLRETLGTTLYDDIQERRMLAKLQDNEAQSTENNFHIN